MQYSSPRWLVYLARFAVALALTVILLGAYTRLKDAGLGCPDWPGCYGEWVLPQQSEKLSAAQALYPGSPIESEKAWTEMVHRYFAGTLGLVIFTLSLFALKHAKSLSFSKALPLTLIGVLIFQALLGMWTVTLKLLPIVVMGHLLGGFLCLTLLWWLNLSLKGAQATSAQQSISARFIGFGIGLLVLQIIVGGWTSANYAALVCPNFPECSHTLWPHFDWQAFNLLGASQLEKPIDFMSYSARTTIHMMHRFGALLNVIVLSLIAFKCWRNYRPLSQILLGLLTLQVALGITNVVKVLPLPIAVLHNGIAALLLLTLITLWHNTRHAQRNRYV